MKFNVIEGGVSIRESIAMPPLQPFTHDDALVQKYTNDLLGKVGDIVKALPIREKQFIQAEVDAAMKTASVMISRNGALEVAAYDRYTRLYDIFERLVALPDVSIARATALEVIALLQAIGVMERAPTPDVSAAR